MREGIVGDAMFLPPATLPRAIPDAAAAAAVFAPLAASPTERVMVAYLGREARLLGVRVLPAGSLTAVPLPIRTIVADALDLDAQGVVLAHNHPSGDHRPSDADLALTRSLAQTLAAVDVRLLDHLIVGGGSTTSFRSLALL